MLFSMNSSATRHASNIAANIRDCTAFTFLSRLQETIYKLVCPKSDINLGLMPRLKAVVFLF
jgi:hypothetical protein